MATQTKFLGLTKPDPTDFVDVADLNANMDALDEAIEELSTTDISSATVALGGALTYNGSARTKTVNSVTLASKTLIAGTDYVVSGNSATNAGTYTLVITGIGKYKGSLARIWEIAKANGSVSVSPSSVNMTGAIGMTRSITVTRSGDGAISATSNNSAVAQVSVSGTTLTVKAVGSGSALITVNVGNGTNHKATSCTLNVSALVADGTLNNNSWEVIRAISDAGVGGSIWSVGATKEVPLEGTVGTLELSSKLWSFIIGFNHNASREGANKIHFQGFKTAQSGGTDVGLVDKGYGNYYTDGTKYFNMNHWGNYNYGGWAASDLRYDVLGSTNVAPTNYGSARTSGDSGNNATATCATNPVAGTLMAALPADLRAVMKPITKYSDNVGGGTGNVTGNVTATVDYLPLLSEYEIHGARSYANSYEQNYQAQYTYYANGNSRIKYQHSAVSTAAVWWSRSCGYFYYDIFCYTFTDGSRSSYFAYYSRALAPAFAV